MALLLETLEVLIPEAAYEEAVQGPGKLVSEDAGVGEGSRRGPARRWWALTPRVMLERPPRLEG